MEFKKPLTKAEAAERLHEALSALEDVRIYMEQSEMMEDLDKVLVEVEYLEDILTTARWAIEAYRKWN